MLFTTSIIWQYPEVLACVATGPRVVETRNRRYRSIQAVWSVCDAGYEVYEDEIQEWIEYATGKRIMIGVRSTDS